MFSKIRHRLYLRLHPRRYKIGKILMQNQFSLYTTDTKDSLDGSSQVRWFINRCSKCNSIFTVTILKDDIPVSTACLSCFYSHLHTSNEKPNAY